METNYDFTPRSLTHDGKPFLPLMGEFHYSRYPARHWARELAKVRAGGVSILASYVIWIHHEEREGCLSFAEGLNLRRFVQLVQQAGMSMFLRIGPWVHGEVRNGGFPDWLLQKPYVPRTNDPAYFADVRRFYTAIFKQVEGLFLHQGGPILGVQIENEYSHGGGLSGEAAEEHMRTLYGMAREIGFCVPYWTATGWGGARTGGLIPVMGGYPDSPWDARTTPIEPSANFVFSAQRNDHAIGSDHAVDKSIHFDPARYPYLTAELGGGLQVTAHRRPIATGRDIEAMSIAKLGSGASLLGYYMFHGGTNPAGELSTLQESKATGYPNDLPVFNYDFNAPLGEYGQLRDSYRRLRRLALFLEDFGEGLADMTVTFPPNNPQRPEDVTTLRHTQRDNGRGGYVFVNNYQRLRTMAHHPATRLEAVLPGEVVVFPLVDIQDGACFFWPFRLPVAGGLLNTANATPLCRLETAHGPVPVFYTDGDPAYCWQTQPQNPPFTLSGADALLACRIQSGKGQHLLLWQGSCSRVPEGYLLEGEGSPCIRVWPPLPRVPEGFTREEEDACGFTVYTAVPRLAEVEVCVEPLAEGCFRLRFVYRGHMAGALLRLDAVYNTARLYVNGEFVADSFYTGQPWEIDLEQYNWPESAEVHLSPLVPGSPLYLEHWPALPTEGEASIRAAAVAPVGQTPLLV